MRLFLSYSHDNRTAVNELVAILKSGGQDVWMDDELVTGQRWQQVLYQEIEKADGIVLAITADWLSSSWCQWEFVTAFELGKKVIPVLLSKTELPERIKQFQYVDFTMGFSDKKRVERFLDDLFSLATYIPTEAVPTTPKSDIEKAVEREIVLRKVTDSNLAASQSGNATSAANQFIKVGDVSRSSITIRQEYSPQRNWTIPVIIVIILALISALAAIFATIPEAQRNPILFGNAPTSTPARLPANAFNVVVAGFAFRNVDGVISQNSVSDDLSDTVYDYVSDLPQVDNLLGWRNNGVGRILGSNSTERQAQAAQIANTLNADVVIYGVVTSNDMFVTFAPEFYVSADFIALEPELLGAASFGSPIEFVANSDDQISASTDLQRRLRILRYFLRGLSLYIAGSFEESEQAFSQASDEAAHLDGLQVLDVFAGNAAARIPNLTPALAHFNEALRDNPEYTRALLGRASVLFHFAMSASTKGTPSSDSIVPPSMSQGCQNLDAPLPEHARSLAELSLNCYQEAESLAETFEDRDAHIKAAFGQGQTSTWLSLNNYGDYWSEAERELNLVVDYYDQLSSIDQLRFRAMAAQSHAWLGLRLLTLDGTNVEAVRTARSHYQTALELLQQDFNRTYNQHWIEIYSNQLVSIDNWLAVH